MKKEIIVTCVSDCKSKDYTSKVTGTRLSILQAAAVAASSFMQEFNVIGCGVNHRFTSQPLSDAK